MFEYLAANTWLIWVATFLILGVLEMFTLELTAAAIAVSAIAGIIAALAGVPFTVQVIIFALVALAMLLFVRPPLLRLMRRRTGGAKTNIDGVVGLAGQLTAVSIGDTPALVRLENGETWTVTSVPPEAAVGAEVRVAEVHGASLVVTLIA